MMHLYRQLLVRTKKYINLTTDEVLNLFRTVVVFNIIIYLNYLLIYSFIVVYLFLLDVDL